MRRKEASPLYSLGVEKEPLRREVPVLPQNGVIPVCAEWWATPAPGSRFC